MKSLSLALITLSIVTSCSGYFSSDLDGDGIKNLLFAG